MNRTRALCVFLATALCVVDAQAGTSLGTGTGTGTGAAPASDAAGGDVTAPPPLDLELATARCGNLRSESALTLLDAARRALCANPRTRQAWAAVEAQKAVVGARKADYWPKLSASAAIGRVTADAQVPGHSELNSSFSGTSNELRLDLNWLLFDFGMRDASQGYETGLLTVALTTLDGAVQSVFLETAETYFKAQSSFAALEAATQAEHLARQILEVVTAKVDAGAGLESDRLQARATVAQASLDRVRTQSAYRGAIGTLAVALHLRPNVEITLAPMPASSELTRQTLPAIEALVGRALNTNPAVLAARARLDAARRAEQVARTAGRPQLALIAAGVRSDTPVDRVATRQTIDTTSVGVQLTVPLFDGQSRRSRIRQSEADALDRDAQLFSASREVENQVWTSYVGVVSSTDELEVCRELLAAAEASYELALGRYRSGIGGMLELLSAQSTVASARMQAASVTTQERLRRIRLSASLGTIDFDALQ